VTLIKVFVTRKECGPRQTVQQGDDFAVRHPPSADINTHTSNGNTPLLQQPPLAGNDVFIHNVYAAVGPRMYSDA
jgi:hypothetical protein